MNIVGQEKRTFGEILNTWVQTIALVLAGIWTLYEFVYKDIYLPSKAPSHIDLKLKLSAIDASKSVTPSIKKRAIRADIALLNTGSHKVFMLPSMFIIWGVTVSKRPTHSVNVRDTALKQVNTKLDSYSSAFFSEQDREVVAAGPIFSEWEFAPKEKADMNVMFYIPEGKYDYLYGKILFFGVKEKDVINVVFKAYSDNDVGVELYKINSDDSEVLLDQENKKEDENFLNSKGYVGFPERSVLVL